MAPTWRPGLGLHRPARCEFDGFTFDTSVWDWDWDWEEYDHWFVHSCHAPACSVAQYDEDSSDHSAVADRTMRRAQIPGRFDVSGPEPVPCYALGSRAAIESIRCT